MNASGDIGQARPRWLGRSLPRVEDRRLVTGAGAYVDDHLPDGCLHLEFVRSPYPHGRLGPLELEEARSAEGVVAVVEGQQVNESAQGVEATLSAILGRSAAYRGREYTWDEMIRENETLEL